MIEDKAREIEQSNAMKARRKSRVRWLQLGEAPTKYFFNHLKVKHARESIRQLRLQNGETTDDEGKILREMFTFYEALYSEDASTENFVRESSSALELITSVSAAEDACMERTPWHEEILEVVSEMPKEKSPGIDGETVEILPHCWTFMGPASLALVQDFWGDGIMTVKALAGVISSPKTTKP